MPKIPNYYFVAHPLFRRQNVCNAGGGTFQRVLLTFHPQKCHVCNVQYFNGNEGTSNESEFRSQFMLILPVVRKGKSEVPAVGEGGNGAAA